MTTNDKRRKPDTERRRPINCLVHPDTLRLLKPLAAHLKLSQGAVIDRAVAALAVAESFGPEHLNIRKVCPHIPSCDPSCELLTIADPYPRKAESFGGEYLRLPHSTAEVVGLDNPPRTFTAPELLAMTDDELDNLPGAPTQVNVTIPTELLEIARTYPALDWNELMQYAIDARRNALAKHRPCVDCGHPSTLLSDDDKLRCVTCNDASRSGGGE